jgi:large subunit ribosomal protein L35
MLAPTGAASLQESKMPKLKTKSGAMKRFKMTASGRVKAGVAG